MTEDEAKMKACCGPIMVSSTLALIDHRSTAKPGADGRCIASDCMAWRWETVANPAWKPQNPMAMYPQPNAYSQVPSGIPSETRGYCGLAGRQ